MKNILQLILKYEDKIKVLLILYVLYCSFIIGVSWDEKYYQIIGKLNLNYLLSFGNIDENFFSKYRYSTFYWSFASLLSQVVPKKFEVEIYHLINSTMGLFTIIGVYQVVKRLFNKKVAKIAGVLLFFIPFFFGHLAINNKDIILTFSHIWIVYYLLKYLDKNYYFKIRFVLLLKLAILSALGTGIQLVFLGSLIPIFFIFLLINFYFKKRNLKNFVYDFLIYVFLFYAILLMFWVDAHENIFTLPIVFFNQMYSELLGWPFNLLNGIYFSSREIPYNYILVNYLYKLPEIVLFLYFISIPLIIVNFKKLKKEFQNFIYIILSVLIMLIYPNIVLQFISFAIYDGVRLFLWSVPYLIVIPSIIVYLIFKYNYIVLKYVSVLLSIFYLSSFITITPYHYTYLNILSGPKNERYQKFENDYWSTSLKELILSSDLKEQKISFYTCGVSPEIVKNYMKQKYQRSEFTNLRDAEYIVMTNRTLFSKKDNKISNCFNEYVSDNVHQVVRNGIILSAIKKINHE